MNLPPPPAEQETKAKPPRYFRTWLIFAMVIFPLSYCGTRHAVENAARAQVHDRPPSPELLASFPILVLTGKPDDEVVNLLQFPEVDAFAQAHPDRRFILPDARLSEINRKLVALEQEKNGGHVDLAPNASIEAAGAGRQKITLDLTIYDDVPSATWTYEASAGGVKPLAGGSGGNPSGLAFPIAIFASILGASAVVILRMIRASRRH